MKLSAFVAIAAVIGGSFLIPNPAEARNGWVEAGTMNDGRTSYVKKISCNGSICKGLEKFGTTELVMADCSNWRYKYPNLTNQWKDVMPGSIADRVQNILCR